GIAECSASSSSTQSRSCAAAPLSSRSSPPFNRPPDRPSWVLRQPITTLGDPVRTKTIFASSLATLLTAATALAQAPAQQPAQPQPFRAGTPLSQTNEAGQLK